ncbi:hypothetical protein FPZ24_04710 [Sphingomonas panacisoli]|uniref:Uncharacterized protein n=1 Tax=Sphingomonas panacisoli TaxID=1813879 RepID=A0A5B8LGW2_9SPHN|nr:hypothetical protein [Sphingomonas panacisoli]QDZ06864.1 hypothetical protein FPZ24_04710 [Sphingomonas panacisoli]
MKLEESLQGEWLVCVDEQCLEEAWSVDVRGHQIDFEGDIGALLFAGEEARLDLKNGDRLIINRRWAPDADSRVPEIPVVIENALGTIHTGWMFRHA